MDAVDLTKRLVRAVSVNPGGDTREVAAILAEALESAGFGVSYVESGGLGPNLVAVLPGAGGRPALCFTGHMDTVPLGETAWSVDPFAALEKDGKIFGRGVSDMKSGLAAMVAGVAGLAALPNRASDLVFLFTAGEETGCQGTADLVRAGVLPGRCGALLVSEPTGCRPVLGHKGVLWLRADFTGKAAHGSMPEAGDNAALKAARAAVGLEWLLSEVAPHPDLGPATINLGVMRAGAKINMVPDAATLEIDLRTIPGLDHDTLEASLAALCGPDARLTRLADFAPVATDRNHPYAVRALALIAGALGREVAPGYVSYFTDASVLTPALGNPPTLVFGPGPAGQAHRTDEWCETMAIHEAARVYQALARDWLVG